MRKRVNTMELTPNQFFLILGLAAIAAELVIFQFSLFWLFFVGLAALIVALAGMVVGDLSWVVAFAIFVVALAVVTVALYKPLIRWSKKSQSTKGNTAIGQKVKVIETISPGQQGKVFWSGTDWIAELEQGCEETLEPDQTATITHLEGIRLTVKV